jgi:hypothetical protein
VTVSVNQFVGIVVGIRKEELVEQDFNEYFELDDLESVE